jgi:hypothetical protein
MSTKDIERSAFSPVEIAARAKVSRAHIYREIASGRLKAKRLAAGKRPLFRITPEAEAEWLASAPPAVEQ